MAIIAGILIYVGQDPSSPTPPPYESAATPSQDKKPSPVSSTTPVPIPQIFGTAIRFSSVTGDRYEASTTSLGKTTSTQGKTAPDGSAFLVLTIRETNLRKDRAAPERLASSPGKIILAVPPGVQPKAESLGLGACEIPGSDAVGDLVQKDPQGISPLPVGACTFALVAESSAESVENQLQPGKSVQIQFSSNGYFPNALPIQELEVWAQFAFTNTAAQLSLP